jgi:hypothetical protein
MTLLTRWEPLREFSTMQTKTEPKLAARIRNHLRSNRFYRLKRTSHAELNSNPRLGPYLLLLGNFVRDSGTPEELHKRWQGALWV